MSPEAYQLARTMVSGDSRQLAEETYFLFAQTGLAHLLCVSGSHFLFLFLLASYIWRLFQRAIAQAWPQNVRWIYARLGKIIFVGCICFLFLWQTGFSKPTVRAFLASICLLLSFAHGMRLRPLWLLLGSSALAYLCGRGSWFSLALSTISVASLVCIPYGRISSRFVRACLFLLAPWLATFPLVIWAFHMHSLIGPLTNFLFAPYLSVIVFFPALLARICASLHWSKSAAYLWDFAAFASELALRCLYWVAEYFPCAVWLNFVPWCLLFLSCTGAILALYRYKFSQRWLVVGSLCLGFLFLQKFLAPATQAIQLDVGQGDSAVLMHSGHLAFLLDTGPAARNPYPARSATELERFTVGSLDSILLTHPDADHIGGLFSVLLRHRLQGNLWLRPTHLNFASTLKILRVSERFQIPIAWLVDGEKQMIYPGLECLPLKQRFWKDTNASSPFCRFQLDNKNSILFTGDADSSVERLYQDLAPDFLPNTYLKLGHHGSRFSSSPEFLKSVGAKLAWISVGRKNRYHHPHPIVLDRLQNLGIAVLRTDFHGALDARGAK